MDSIDEVRKSFGLDADEKLLGDYFCQYTLLPEEWVTGRMYIFQSCVCALGSVPKKLAYNEIRNIRLRRDSVLQVLNPAYTVQVLAGTEATQLSWLFAEDAYFELLFLWTVARWKSFTFKKKQMGKELKPSPPATLPPPPSPPPPPPIQPSLAARANVLLCAWFVKLLAAFKMFVGSKSTHKGMLLIAFWLPLKLLRLLFRIILCLKVMLLAMICALLSMGRILTRKLKGKPKSEMPTVEDINGAAEVLENLMVKVKDASEQVPPDLLASTVGHCASRVEKVYVAARLLAGFFLTEYVAGRIGALKEEEAECTRVEQGDQTEANAQSTQDAQTGDELDAFQSEAMVLRKALHERKKELVDAKRTVIEQKLEIEEKQGQLDRSLHQNYSLEFQVEKYKTEASNTSRQADAAQEKVSEMEEKLVAMGGRVLALENSVQEKNVMIKEAERSLREITRKPSEDKGLKVLISDLHNEQAALIEQLREVQQELKEEKTRPKSMFHNLTCSSPRNTASLRKGDKKMGK